MPEWWDKHSQQPEVQAERVTRAVELAIAGDYEMAGRYIEAINYHGDHELAVATWEQVIAIQQGATVPAPEEHQQKAA